jgi:hypothetical protein
MAETVKAQVLGFVDRNGQNVTDFRKAKTVMVHSGCISRMVDAKAFRRPIKITETVEIPS